MRNPCIWITTLKFLQPLPQPISLSSSISNEMELKHYSNIIFYNLEKLSFLVVFKCNFRSEFHGSSYNMERAEDFLQASRLPSKSAIGLHVSGERRRFLALLSVFQEVYSALWILINPCFPSKASPKHLCWSLLFLKCYCSDNVRPSISNAYEKTVRKWIWCIDEAILNMRVGSHFPFNSLTSSNVFRFSDRRLKGDPQLKYRTSAGGIDCSIFEPELFSAKWFSHILGGTG